MIAIPLARAQPNFVKALLVKKDRKCKLVSAVNLEGLVIA